MKNKIKIKTVDGIQEVDILAEFECNGRKFVVNHLIVDHHYHVVTDFKTGYMIGDIEFGIKRAIKSGIKQIESRPDFDYDKYETINEKVHENIS